MKIKCGITGHTGVLGKSVIKKLPFKFIKFKGDVTKRKQLNIWFKKNKLDIVMHLAAIVPTDVVKKNIKRAYKVNYDGTKNIVDEIIKNSQIKWFFFSSTSHVYDFSNKKISENFKLLPKTIHGSTKVKAEKYIIKKLRKRRFCIGRIFSFTGKGQSEKFVLPAIIKKIKSKNKVIKFSNLEHFRDFVSLDDISNAILCLCKKNSSGIFNIGNSRKILLSDIARKLSKKQNKKIIISKNKVTTSLIANNNKLKKLGWIPKSNINDILKELI